MIRINHRLSIPEEELTFITSRNSGPGGQNVNKVETRVTLRFDLDASQALDEEAKERLRERLATRINKAGVLSVRAGKHRTQGANRELVRERFADLLREALTEDAERRPTRVPRGVVRRRLQKKRQRSQRKQERRRKYTPDD